MKVRGEVFARCRTCRNITVMQLIERYNYGHLYGLRVSKTGVGRFCACAVCARGEDLDADTWREAIGVCDALLRAPSLEMREILISADRMASLLPAVCASRTVAADWPTLSNWSPAIGSRDEAMLPDQATRPSSTGELPRSGPDGPGTALLVASTDREPDSAPRVTPSDASPRRREVGRPSDRSEGAWADAAATLRTDALERVPACHHGIIAAVAADSERILGSVDGLERIPNDTVHRVVHRTFGTVGALRARREEQPDLHRLFLYAFDIHEADRRALTAVFEDGIQADATSRGGHDGARVIAWMLSGLVPEDGSAVMNALTGGTHPSAVTSSQSPSASAPRPPSRPPTRPRPPALDGHSVSALCAAVIEGRDLTAERETELALIDATANRHLHGAAAQDAITSLGHSNARGLMRGMREVGEGVWLSRFRWSFRDGGTLGDILVWRAEPEALGITRYGPYVVRPSRSTETYFRPTVLSVPAELSGGVPAVATTTGQLTVSAGSIGFGTEGYPDRGHPTLLVAPDDLSALGAGDDTDTGSRVLVVAYESGRHRLALFSLAPGNLLLVERTVRDFRSRLRLPRLPEPNELEPLEDSASREGVR